MPIYEYQCYACGHELEALQKISDDALVHCPECNDDSLKKKISAAGFQLKGTGWYETDFKNAAAKPKDSQSDAPKSSGDDKASKQHSCGAACNHTS